MITIHEKTAQNFDTLGLGALLPSSCVVTEEINGAYELKMKHPYDEHGKWERIERGRIIASSTPRGVQFFRIYNAKPNMDSIEVNARHVFYDLLDNQCSEISYNGTASGALAALQGAFALAMPFSFGTDISASGTLETGKMNPVQALLSDDDETTSFVKGFGGELLRDGFKVALKTAMGQDRDVAIRYGKNLAALDVTEDEADVKTRIMCYGSDGSAMVDSPYLNEYVYPKIHTLEDKEKTVEELKAEAQALCDSGVDIPLVIIKVDFIVLADTVEYADYAPLEEVFLGDIVTIINQKMNFAKKARVISYEWDCLLERYNEVELGDFMPTLAASVTSGVRSGSLASAASVTASAVAAALNSHVQDKNNPHGVTAEQTGGNSGGSSDADALLELLAEHEADKDNPHGVTAKQVGAYTKDEVDMLVDNLGGSGTSVLYGTESPDDAVGSDGSLYLQTGSSEYTAVAFIESSGTQHINTRVIPKTGKTRVILHNFRVVNHQDVWNSYFGSQTSDTSADNFRFRRRATVDGLCANWGNAAGTYYSNYIYNGYTVGEVLDTVEFGCNGLLINGELATASVTTTPVGGIYPIYLNASNEAGSATRHSAISFSSCEIYEGDTLIRDYVACINASGEVGLYDKKHGGFYANEGAGLFSAGPEIAQLVGAGSLWLKQNGTWTQVLKGAA